MLIQWNDLSETRTDCHVKVCVHLGNCIKKSFSKILDIDGSSEMGL